MKEGEAHGESIRSEGEEFRFSPQPNRAHEINWRPWGEEAFRRAREEKKPVLLSISAVWCHWCHVMDETTYSDPEVISLINRHFIPIRVDSDRNPDINSRYNQGGWPTTAFLNHRAAALAGATYIPPETMRKVLERISELYRRHAEDITYSVEETFPQPEEGKESLHELVESTGEDILRSWDRAHGGLGGAPKFPLPEDILLALELRGDGAAGEYLEYARSSLQAMIRGGLMDRVEGGFFRYSTTPDWSIPHYEKMLLDNSELLSALLKAYNLTGESRFRSAAEKTASYIKRTLSDGKRRFYGSQDADEEYYLLGAAEREGRTPPPVDRTVYSDITARAAIGLLEAGAALGRRDYADLALASLQFLWAEGFREKEGLAHYLNGEPRRWGLLDDQTMAAAALARAYGFTGESLYLNRARALLDLVREMFWDQNKRELMDTSPGHSPVGLKPEPATLSGQAKAAEAMLLYWAYSGEEEWRRLAGLILSRWASKAASLGFMAAPLARAANLYLHGPLMVRIWGEREESVEAFLRVAHLSPKPRLLVLRLEVGTMDKEAVAEVCTMESCRLRTGDIEKLADHLAVSGPAMEEVLNHASGLPG